MAKCSTGGCERETTLASGVCTSCIVEARFPNARVVGQHDYLTGHKLGRQRKHRLEGGQEDRPLGTYEGDDRIENDDDDIDWGYCMVL